VTTIVRNPSNCDELASLCLCDCVMRGLSVSVSGLPSSSCEETAGAPEEFQEYWRLDQDWSAVDGSYLLYNFDESSGYWYRNIGDANEHGSGIRIGYGEYKAITSGEISAWQQREIWCVQVSGRIDCDDCTTEDPPEAGSLWRGVPTASNAGGSIDFGYPYVYWGRDYDVINEEWVEWSRAFHWFPALQDPTLSWVPFNNYVTPPACDAPPPGCQATVHIETPVNLVLDCEVGPPYFDAFEETGGVATGVLAPIGDSTPCE
jgi:hypothetical protein